jgi:hypothetical protein
MPFITRYDDEATFLCGHGFSYRLWDTAYRRYRRHVSIPGSLWYEIDVLRLFTDIARQRKLIIKWCGSADENTLTYAEQGYADYKRYNINDYDITVVK